MAYLSILAISIHGEISLICSNYFDLIVLLANYWRFLIGILVVLITL